MIVSRRHALRLIAGTAAAARAGGELVPRAEAAPGGPLVFGGGMDAGDRLVAGRIDGAALVQTGEASVPIRLHGFAAHPRRAEMVAPGRRPADTAFVIDRDSCRVTGRFASTEGRRFSGHGCFLPDGSRFVAIEIDYDTGAGFLVLRDPEKGYAADAVHSSGGVGPHEAIMLGRFVVVANGAQEPKTDPGIAVLAKVSAPSSIVLMDPATGAIEDRVEAAPDLRSLSLRHLAATPDGRVVVTAQDTDIDARDRPLVGTYERGRLDWLDTPPAVTAMLRSYIGSTAVDSSGRFAAATSPRGGLVVVYDLTSRSQIGEVMLPDVCGVAADTAPGHFIVTSGHGALARIAATEDAVGLLERRPSTLRWDHHLTVG